MGERMVKRARRAIKGVSPVLATLILIVIAVVAGLIVYGWITGWMRTKLPSEELQIDKVYTGDLGGEADPDYAVVITNTGKVKITVDKITLIYGTSTKEWPPSPGVTQTIDLGATVVIEIYDWSDGPEVGSEITIKVHTTRGNVFEATLPVESPPS